ncbi:MAG: fluoride efflux transporter CrcB [Alphaproteobacteria bacterium]
MNTFIAVAAGGALGSVLRHGVNLAAARWLGLGFPWGTFVDNVGGCFFMGVVAAAASRKMGLSPEWWVFLATGLLGGFTTFSAFSLDVTELLGQGYFARAALYFSGTLILAFLGFYLGAGATKLVLS